MDSRREVRVPVGKTVVLTVLGEPEVRLTARVKDASPRGLGVMVGQPVRPGAAVKIETIESTETKDAIFLGEAVRCRAVKDGWLVGVRLTEVLTGLAALARMARQYHAVFHPACPK